MNKNRIGKSFLSLLLLASAFAFPNRISGRQANADTLALSPTSAAAIDGKIEADEWLGAIQKELSGGGKVYFKFDGNYVYVGIRNAKAGWAHLYLSEKAGGDVSVLHASASLGKIVYRQDRNKLWQTSDKYVWSLRERTITDETRQKMSEYLSANGWLANNNNTGNPGEIEFQFKPATNSFYLAVLFAGDAKKPQFYPATLTDSTLLEELIRGNTPIDLKFNQKQWLKINLKNRQKSARFS